MAGAVDFFIEEFKKLIETEPRKGNYYRPRPYRNASVKFRDCSIEDFEERKKCLEDAGLNSFLFPASKIPGCDLLSDSGTTTMTAQQWAQIMLGDEAYGSNEGYFQLKDTLVEIFGPDWKQQAPEKENMFLFHQGRSAENAIFSNLARILPVRGSEPLSDNLSQVLKDRVQSKLDEMDGAYYIIPNNSHFDTTEANVFNNNIVPLNIPCKEHLAGDETCPFRGDMDIEMLKELLENERERIPMVYITITNNTGGGQPVSMANIKAVSELCKKAGVPFFFDACRFAENAYFIKCLEEDQKDRTIIAIVKEMFDCVDGFQLSFKKDGMVNIGGGLVIKDSGIFDEIYPQIRGMLTDHQILTEGHPTYGGMAGRDLKGLIEGLHWVVKEEYLEYRIGQSRRFGEILTEYEIPVIRPYGGHAIYLSMDRFFEGVEAKDEDFKSISFTALLLLAGHRLCELGIFAFGRYDGVEHAPNPRVNFVRAAIPRLAYEDQDLYALAEAIKVLHDNRDKIPPVDVNFGRDLPLRHFKSRFKFRE